MPAFGVPQAAAGRVDRTPPAGRAPMAGRLAGLVALVALGHGLLLLQALADRPADAARTSAGAAAARSMVLVTSVATPGAPRDATARPDATTAMRDRASGQPMRAQSAEAPAEPPLAPGRSAGAVGERRVGPVSQPPAAAAPADDAGRPRPAGHSEAGSAADTDEPPSSPAGTAPPLYRPALPASTELHFRFKRGQEVGTTRLAWRIDGERYVLSLLTQGAAGRPVLEQRSTGATGEQGLAPDRFQDRRAGRGERTADFDRALERVAFSGRAPDLPLWAGTQDRLGWIVQFVGIAAAAAAPPDEVMLHVVGARGGGGVWVFRLQGAVDLDTPLGPVRALHYERRPAVLRDQAVEIWIDPSRGHWPVHLRMTPVLGGPPQELWLSAEPRPLPP
jgi:hypothetical protein